MSHGIIIRDGKEAVKNGNTVYPNVLLRLVLFYFCRLLVLSEWLSSSICRGSWSICILPSVTLGPSECFWAKAGQLAILTHTQKLNGLSSYCWRVLLCMEWGNSSILSDTAVYMLELFCLFPVGSVHWCGRWQHLPRQLLPHVCGYNFASCEVMWITV